MERTKNLSASPQEREAYRRREREKHIRGLVQRLLDYSLTLDDIKDELAKEKKNGREAEVMAFLKKTLAAQSTPRRTTSASSGSSMNWRGLPRTGSVKHFFPSRRNPLAGRPACWSARKKSWK